jgi:site-specific recombinase XerD
MARKTRKVVQKPPRPSRTPANSGKKYPAEVLTEAEVASLIRACSPKAPTGIRNRALITVMYRAGLRVSEALALFPKDVDADAGTVTVLHGKGDKRRTVGVDAGAFAVLARWLDRRPPLGLNGRTPIFCTLQGASLKSAYVRALLPRLAAKAGVEKRVHPHGLRHTHAAELAREGTPLNLVQAQLGHSSLATTDRYLRHIAPEELVKAMKARVWTPPED